MAGTQSPSVFVPLDEQGDAIMRAIPDDRRGFALVLALLALMVLAGIAAAALAAALGQLRAAGSAGRVLGGQTGATASVEEAIEGTRGQPASVVGGPAVEMSRDTVGSDGMRRALDLRIAPEFHLLVGEASWDGGVPTRYARVVWWLDPEARVGGHRAVLEAAAVVVAPGSRVRTDLILQERPGVPGCSHLPLLAQAFGHPGSLLNGALPQPPEWGAGSDDPDFDRVRLGRFSASMLDSLADARLSGDGRLVPACAGCWSGLVFGSGAAHLLQQGAGVLAVDGDLTVEAGASWTGLLLAAGDLTMASGSRITGLLRAGGTLTVAPGVEVDGSACAAIEALNRATSLARLLPLPGRTSAGPVSPAGGSE